MNPTLALLLLCSGIADARIGESLKQIEKRLGKAEVKEVSSSGYGYSLHTHNGVSVMIEYVNGAAACEGYYDISIEDAEAILTTQGGLNFVPKEYSSESFDYTDSRGIKATVYCGGQTFMIIDDGRIRKLEKKLKAHATK